MNKAPNTYRLENLRDELSGNSPKACINNKWVPARPLGLYGIKNRLRVAFMVFTGKADALIWPEGQ